MRPNGHALRATVDEWDESTATICVYVKELPPIQSQPADFLSFISFNSSETI